MVKLALTMPYNLASLNGKGESSLANFVRQVVDHITSMLKFLGCKRLSTKFFNWAFKCRDDSKWLPIRGDLSFST
jgi:hypothetical protein